MARVEVGTETGVYGTTGGPTNPATFIAEINHKLGEAMRTKRSKARKGSVTDEMLLRRARRLTRLGTLLPIEGELGAIAAKRYFFLDFAGSTNQIQIRNTFETLKDARDSFSTRGESEFDPNSPPRLVVDLDSSEFMVTAVSYNAAAGVELEEEFLLEGDRDYQWQPEAGGSWRDAYWMAPAVHPDLSADERSAKLRDWLESERRLSWDPGDDE